MEVRNAVLVSLLIDLAAIAVVLLPGAGTASLVAAGIAVSLSGGLLLLAALSWRWQEAATPLEPRSTQTDVVEGDEPAALAG